MALSWITPKTNWTKTDKFTITDYNRIRNNLLYINDVLNERCPDKAQTLDLGDPVVYSHNYYPRQFNAFEDALESFTRVGGNVNIGSKKTFKGNDPFIDSQELNRIEGCCLRWYNYDPIIHVSSISISPKSATLQTGQTKSFAVTCLPANGEEVNDWVVSSSNTSVLRATKSGMNVIGTAVGEGTATINVSAYKSSDSALINVESVKVTQIILDKDYLDVESGVEFKISYQLLPSNAINKDKLKVTTTSSKITIKLITESYITAVSNGNGSADDGYIVFEVGEVSAKAYITAKVVKPSKIWVGLYSDRRTHETHVITEINLTYANSRVKEWFPQITYSAYHDGKTSGEYINHWYTITSSDTSVYEGTPRGDSGWWEKVKKRGTCTLTFTLREDTSVSCTVTVNIT